MSRHTDYSSVPAQFQPLLANLKNEVRKSKRDPYACGLARFKLHYALWRFIHDTNLDDHPELAVDVVNACRTLIDAINKREGKPGLLTRSELWKFNTNWKEKRKQQCTVVHAYSQSAE
jgi:hypothetical protein